MRKIATFVLAVTAITILASGCSRSNSSSSSIPTTTDPYASLPASDRRMIKEYPKSPIEEGTAVIVHGDLTESAECSFRVFYAGDTIPWLGWGTYKFYVLTGTPEEIEAQIDDHWTSLLAWMKWRLDRTCTRI